MERSLLLLLFIAVCASAGRILPRHGICTKTCNPSAFAKFKFQTGRDYHYDYLSHSLTGLDGGDKQSSGLRIKARASFEVISPCEMVLRMRSVRVEELSPEDGSYSDSPRTADFKYAVERHELHFSFEDGSIPHLCPVKEEQTWVLNVKRGVISMMQNTMPTLTTTKHVGTEIDVAGECKAHYTITPRGIRREKDLRACSGRENRESALQSIPYFVRSNTQAAPLTMSSHVCHQTISSYGHFEKIFCEEEHRLHSISRGQKSARTTVTQSLVFISDSDAPSRSHAHSHRRTTLRFDFEKNLKRSVHDLAEARDYLRDVCAKSRSDVRPETPRFFTEIVYRLRRLNEKDLRTIFTLVDRRKACRSNNDVVRRLVIDAIPILGNAQSMSLMKMMIMSGRVSNIEANLWLTSLAFVQRPTLDMLRFLKPLVDEEKPRTQAVLGLSAMVHQYCSTRRECYTEQVIQDIGRSLRKMINSDCTAESVKEQTKILLALKAIGNAGVLSVVSPDLVRCINKEENPMAIRVAATEAFRRMDCSVNRKPLIEVYRKQELDSELRINAYLAVMTCPSEEILEIVKTQLNSEKVNQVGSFVWTHLTNLAETNDPLRKHVKDIVEDVKLKREFKLDKLKFSRNIEKSAFLKSFNAGGRMESNVIWSQRSFLPRSVSLNLTTHLFGQSYNFLEFNGRVEGLEDLLERYIGPDGYFKKGAKNNTALSNKDFQFMDNKFKLQNDKQRLDLGFRVFGHEVFFFDRLSTDEKKKEGFNFLEVLIKLASNQEMEWSKNVMFLDSKITIPTISGLPLELSINGTTSVNVKAKGKLDIRRMVSWPSTFDIDGTLQPSGSVEVSAMMGVNAYYTRHGLKMVTNAHTSTQIDAKLKAKDSETFDVEFGMPRDKQEIVNFESKFYVVHRNTEKEHSLPNVKRVNRKFCTGKTFERTTGAELCATVRSPAISSFQDLIVIPVVGPFSASVALYKRDTHSSYRLSARWQRKKHRLNNQVYYSRFARFEIDTPNSQVSRRHLADFALDFDSRAVRFHLENPTRRIGFSGAFTNKMGRKELKLSFFKDNTAYFHVQMANRITRKGQTSIMTPSLKIMIPGVPFISLISQFKVSPSKFDFNAELKNLLRGPLIIGGSSAIASSKQGEAAIAVNAFMTSHFFVGSFSKSIRRGRSSLISAMKLRYGPTIAKQHTAEFNSNMQRILLRGERRYRLDFNHFISQWPACRSKAITIVKLARRNVSFKTITKYGTDLKKLFIGEMQMKAQRNAKHGITMTSSGSVRIPHLSRFHSGKTKVVTEPSGVTVSVNYRHVPKERTFKLIYNARMTRVEQSLKVTTDIAAHYKDQHKLVADMEVTRHSAAKYTMITRGAFNGRKAVIDGTLEFPEPERVSSVVNIRVGASENIRAEMNTRYNIYTPSIALKVDRNGASHSMSANYNFNRVSPGGFQLTFNSQTACPRGQTKMDGEFKFDDGNFDGNVKCQWGDSTSMKDMVIQTNYQRTIDGNKRKREFELKWNHPSRQGHIQMNLEREDYKGLMHLELETAPKKQFVIDSMFEIDDGWTQKGLMASMTVKTPFKRFERTHLGVNLLGQLRYRRAEINFLWGNNKRIVTTLVIRPTGGTNFLATLKVVTPFARYSYMRFHLKNEFTGHQLQSELISEIGTKKTYLKVYGVNNGDSYMNDLAMSVSMNSPFEEFRDVTLTIDHKDDSNQYNSKLEFKWNKNKKISTITNFNYNRNGAEVRTSGMVTYTTPFTGIERGAVEWQHQNTESMLKSEVNVEYIPDKKIGIKLNGLVTEPEEGALRITGTSSIVGTNFGNIDSEFLHHHTPNSLKIRATCDLPQSRSYEFEVTGSKDEKRIEGDINLNTPHDGFRKIGASLDIKNEESSKILKSFVYAGNTKAALASVEGKVTIPTVADPTMAISARLENKIVRDIEISFTHQHHLDVGVFTSATEVTYAPSKTLALTSDISWNHLKKWKTSITTPFQRFRTFRLFIEFEGDAQQFQHTHFLNCNDKFEMSGGVRYNGVKAIIAESKVSYQGFHYFRFSHKKNGNVYETNVIGTVKTSNTIRLSSEVQVDPRFNVEVKLNTPFDVIRNVQAKLSSQGGRREPLVVQGSASYTFAEKVITMNGLFNMKDTEDMRANFEMKTPFDDIRDVSVMLQHTKNGKEFVTTAIGKSENGRVELMNIFQKVGTLKNKFVIKTPFHQFKGITFSFEHRGRFPKLSHRHHLSFNIGGISARLNNKFDVYKLRLIEVESTFRSNVEVIKKAGFRFTFDKPIGGIETGILVEWPQDKVEGRIAFKSSSENKVQLKISTPFYYFKELQGLYKLQNQGFKNFKHQIILAFKNEPLTMAFENALTIKTASYIDAYLKINTPVDQLKSFAISYHHEMLKRGKSVEAKAEYNDMKYAIKGTYSKVPIHVVEVTLKTPHRRFRSISHRNELLLKDNTNWKFTSELQSTELAEKFTVNVNLKNENNVIEFLNSISQNGKVGHELGFKTSWEDEKMYTGSLVLMNTLLPKSATAGRMISIEGTADLRKAVNLRLTLRTPFKKVENQWVTLRFERNDFLKSDTLKTGSLIVKGNLMSKTATLQARYSFGKRPSFQVLVQLPDMQDMKLEGSLVMSATNSYMKMSLNVPDHLSKPWNLMVDVTKTKTITVSFKLDTSIEKYETIAGRASITKEQRFAKITGRLSLPVIKKPIEFNLEGDLRTSFRLAANLKGPIVRFFRYSLHFSGDSRKFQVSSEIFSAHLSTPCVFNFKFSQKSGLKIEHSIRTPLDVLSRLFVEVSLSQKNRRGHIEIDHNKLAKPIRLEGKFDASETTFKGRVFLKTPFEQAEHSEVNVDFEKVGYKVTTSLKAKTSAMEGQILGNLKFNFDQPTVTLKAKLETPFEQMKEGGLDLELKLQKDASARLMLTHNKLQGEITNRFELQAGKSIEFELSTPFQGWYKHALLSVNAQKTGERHKISSLVRYYPTNVMTATVEAEVSLPKIFLSYNIATPFNVLRQTYGSVNIRDTNLLEGELYHNALSEKITLSVRTTDAETKTLIVQWNGPFKGPLKDISAKFHFTPHTTIKSVSLPLKFSTGAKINYHTDKEITLFTSIDVSSFKNFHIKMKAATPFEVMKTASFRVQADVQKNIRLLTEVTHNKLPEGISASLLVDIPSRVFDLRLSTPFDGPHKHITVIGSIKKSGSKQVFQASAEYYPSRKLSVSGEVNPDVMDLLASIKITTPFEMMKEMTGKLTFNPMAAPMLRFEINHNKLPSKIEARVHVRPIRRLKIILKTPFEGPWKNILVDYRLKRAGATETATAVVKYHPDTVLRSQLSYEKQEKALTARLTVTTPFEAMKKMETTFTSNWETGVVSTLRIDHNKLSDSLNIVTSYSKKEAHLVQVALKTPFEIVNDLDVKVSYLNKDNVKKSTLTVNYNKSKTYELHGYLKSTDSVKKVSMGLKTPFKGIWRSMSFSSQYRREAQKHSVDMKAIYDSVKTIEVSTLVNTDINDLQVAYSIKTPFEVMKFTEGKMTLTIVSTKYFRSATADKRFNAQVDFFHNKLMNGKKLTITAVGTLGTNDKSVNVEIKVLDRTFNGRIFYKKDGNRFSIGSSIVTDKPDRPWFVEANVLANGLKDWEITASATSPEHRLDYERPGVFKVNAKHTGDLNAFENSLDITSPYKKDVKFSSSFDKSANYKTKLVLRAPMNIVEEIKFTHVGDETGFTTVAQATLTGMDPFVLSAVSTGSKSFCELVMNLKLPLESWKENTMKISQKRGTTKTSRSIFTTFDFTSTGLGKLNVMNDFNMSPSGITNMVSMKNRLENSKAPETLKINFKVSPMTPEESSAELTIDTSALTESIKLNAAWKKTSDSLRSTFEINAIKDFLKTKAVLDIPIMKIDNVLATFSLNSEAMKEPAKLSVSWEKTSSSFEGTIDSQIPVTFLKSKITVLIPKMSRKESDATVSITSSDMSEPAKLSIYWKKAPSTFMATVDSKIPVKFLKSKVQVTIPTMKLDETQAQLSLTSSELNEPATVSVSWKKTAKSLKADVMTSIPVKYMKTTASLDIPTMSSDETVASVTFTSKDLSDPARLAVDWKKTSTSFKGNFVSQIAAIKYLPAKIAVDIAKMQKDEVMATVTVTANELEEDATLSVEWKKTETSFKGSIASKIPVKYLKSKVSITIPKMGAKNTDATIIVESQEMEKPITVAVTWEKSASSFKSSITSDVPVLTLKSSLELKSIALDNFDSAFELESAALGGKSTAKLSWKKEPKAFKTNFDLETPEKSLKKVNANFFYKVDSNIESALIVSANRLGRLEATLKRDNVKRAHQFNVDVENYRSGEKLFSLSYVGRSTSSKLTIEMPNCKTVKKIEYNYQREGKNTDSSLIWDSNKVSLQVQRPEISKMIIAIETTFEQLKTLKIELNFPFTQTEKEVSVTVEHPKGRTFVKVTSTTVNGLKMTGTIENSLIPKVPNMSVEMDYQGKSARKFKNVITVKVGEKEGKVETNFNILDTTEGSLRVTTPFEKFEEQTVDFALDRSKPEFSAALKTGFGSGSVKLESGASPADAVTLTLKFNKNVYQASVNYSGTTKSFTAGLNIFQGAGRVRRSTAAQILSIKVASELKDASYSGSVNVASKFLPENYQNLEAQVNAKGDFKLATEFSLDASAIVNKRTYSTELKWYLAKSGSISFKFPGKQQACVISGDVSVDLTQGIKVESKASKCDGEIYSVNIKSNLKNSLDASLTSRLEGSNTDITYRHEAGTKTVSGQVTFKNAKLGEYNGRFTASWEKDVTANLKVELPDKSTSELDLKQTGTPEAMTVEVSVTKADKPLVNGKLSYSIKNPISIKFTLETPFEKMKKTELSFNHKSENNLFSTRLDFSHNILGDYVSTLNYDGRQRKQVIFTLDTPYKLLKELKVLFSYSGEITTNFDHAFFVTYNKMKMGYSVNLVLPKLLYRIEIDTPFSGYRKIVITNEHEGNKDKFSHKIKVYIAPGRHYQVHLDHHKTSDSYNGNLRFNLPFKTFDRFHLKLHHQRAGPTKWLMNHQLTFAPGKVISAEGVLNHGLPHITAVLKIKTPFKQIEIIQLSCEHKHRSNVDFDFNHSLRVNQKSGTFRGSLKHDDEKLVGLIVLKTPFERMRFFDAGFRHVGGLRQFSNDAALSYAKGRTLSLKTRFDITKRNTFNTEMHLKTPFDQFRTGKLIIFHQGTLKQHVQRVEVGANGKTFAYNGKVSAVNPMDMATEHTFTMPFTAVRSIKVQFDHKNGVAHLNFLWNKVNYVKIMGILNRQNLLLAKLTVTTSIPSLQESSISVRHSGKMNDFTTATDFNFNGALSTFKLGFRRSMPKLSLQASLPHGPRYEVKLGMQKVGEAYQGNFVIVEGKREILRLDSTTKYDFSRPRKMLNVKFSGRLPTKQMNEITMEVTFSGDKRQFVIMTKSNFFNRHQISTTLNYNTYKAISVQANYNGMPYSFGYTFGPSSTIVGKTLTVSMKVGARKGSLTLDMARNMVEMTMRTPFEKAEHIYLKVHHIQKSRFNFVHRSIFELNNYRYVNLDLSMDPGKGKIAMKAPAVVTIKYSMTGARVIRAMFEVDPDKSDASKKVVVTTFMFYDNDESRRKTTHEMSLAIKTKSRDFKLETKTERASSSFFHKTIITPDQKTSQPWKIYLSSLKHATEHKMRRTDEWLLSTPVREMKVFMVTEQRSGKLVNHLFFHWDNQRAPLKKMGWKLKVEKQGKETTAVVTFHHPRFREGVSLQTKSIVNSGNTIIRTKANLRYSDDPREAIDFALKVSRAGQKMVRGSMSIRQKATQLNTRLSGSFGGNRGVYINGLTLAHQMNGKSKVFQVLSHVNVLKRSLMLEIVTPMRSLSWMSVANVQESGVTINYQLAIDRSKKAFGEVVFAKSPSFKTRLYLNPGNSDNYIETYGRFVNKKHFEFQIHRMMENRRYSDFVFTLRLQGEHLLKSRLFWRPSLLGEARQYIRSQIEGMKADARIMWPRFVASLRKEWNMKKSLIIATIPNFEDLRDYSKAEIALVKEDLYRIAGMVYDSYIANDFYLNDIAKFVWKHLNTVKRRATVMTVNLRRSIFEVYLPRISSHLDRRPQWRKFKRVLHLSLLKATKMASAMSTKMQTAGGVGKRHIYRGVEKVSGMVKSMHQRYSTYETHIFSRMHSAATAARQHYVTVVRPRYEKVRAMVSRGLKALSKYHSNSKESLLSHFHQDLRTKMTQVHSSIQRGIDTVSHRYGLLFHALRQKMNRRLNRTLDFSHARYASGILKSGIQKIQWAYDQFDVEQKLKDFGHAQYLKAIQYIKENSIDVIRDYLRMEQSRMITFEPSKGKIEGQVYIPFEMQDLQSRPDFSSLRRTTSKIRKAFRRPSSIRMPYFPSMQSIKQHVLRYIPSIEKNPRAWMPTFRGYASITGKHIVTFDKVHYDLDGNCDYVLARDYKQKNWAVVLNQATKKRHITFVAYNKVFGIHPDYSVTVDGMKVELPFVHGNLSILRFGPIIKAKDTVLGFSVTSDVVNDIHTVGVTGWYHGKLGGLFGNFDNEPFNDMQTTDHQITEEPDTFIQTWALRNCRHNNNAGPHKKPSKIATKVCKFLFGCPLSPMARCFKHVDPRPFLKTCLSDVDEMESTGPKARICRAARLYAFHCRMAHVRVRIPRPCRRCAVPGRESIKEDSSVTIDNTKATADVIFVVEESPCNKDVVPRLSDIVRRMEGAFKSRGITDNRYGLIGFGRSVHGLRKPITHSHTVNSQLMGEATSFTKALSNFELEENMLNSTDTYDPLRAIMKASEYPLRPGSARHIVVLPCSACHERRVSSNEVEEALKDQDIILYVLFDQQIRLRRPSMVPQSNYLFGVDKRAVFTQKDVEQLRWDTRLMRQVVRPRDVCSQMAYSTGGAVFNSRKLTKMHVTSQVWFAQVFANRVASSSHSPKQVDCECNVNRRDRPNLICKKNGSAVVRGVPQPVPLPLALPQRQESDMKLSYRR